MAKRQKYYVVWKGREPGVYTSWEVCQLQVEGFIDARYKAYDTEEEAERAFADGPQTKTAREKTKNEASAAVNRTGEALVVDAACSVNPGPMEYRGVYLPNKQQVFHHGPIYGTNNIGEFLAIVHALALLKVHHKSMPVYSDSANAISWIKQRRCKTRLERNQKTKAAFELIERAERWLRTHDYSDIPVIKWQTKDWGEIPADFGRK